MAIWVKVEKLVVMTLVQNAYDYTPLTEFDEGYAFFYLREQGMSMKELAILSTRSPKTIRKRIAFYQTSDHYKARAK